MSLLLDNALVYGTRVRTFVRSAAVISAIPGQSGGGGKNFYDSGVGGKITFRIFEDRDRNAVGKDFIFGIIARHGIIVCFA